MSRLSLPTTYYAGDDSESSDDENNQIEIVPKKNINNVDASSDDTKAMNDVSDDSGNSDDDDAAFVNPIFSHLKLRKSLNQSEPTNYKKKSSEKDTNNKEISNNATEDDDVNNPPKVVRPPLEEGEFWCVTSYFNPKHYTNRYDNYQKFKRNLQKQQVKLLTVELSQDGKFELSNSDAMRLIRVSSSAIMWHKERLLNIGINNLPDACTKVCWLDCDIIFQRDDWVRATSALLDRFRVVQPFSSAIFMGPDETPDKAGRFQAMPGFAKFYWHDFNHRSMVSAPLTRAHPGYAWAARMDVLEATGGLFDKCIAGHADLTVAVAFTHDPEHQGPIKPDQAWGWDPGWSLSLKHAVREYQDLMASVVVGSMGFVQGNVYHMWHGSKKNRNWDGRGKLLEAFDPDLHLVDRDPNQPLEWSEQAVRDHMPEKLNAYFTARREDERKW